MDAAEWLARFDRVGEEYRVQREVNWARIAAEKAPVVRVMAAPVVLEAGREIDLDDEVVSAPAAARRVASAGRATGWSVRLVASRAAVPAKGLVEVVTARARRGDERLWAAWWNGRFDVAWRVGLDGLEQLGWARMGGNRKTPLKMRGVLDAIEDVRRPDQWIDLLERQDVARATGLIAQAFPGLCLTRH